MHFHTQSIENKNRMFSIFFFFNRKFRFRSAFVHFFLSFSYFESFFSQMTFQCRSKKICPLCPSML